MKTVYKKLLLAMAFQVLYSPLLLAAEILQCKVVKIIDGDSVVVRVGKAKKEIRLWGIDCPEHGQPYAEAAKKITSQLLNDEITIRVKGRDDYNRILGIAYKGDSCVNKELVWYGAAWVYDYYCRDKQCREWARVEKIARRSKRGLWQDNDPIPPWKWRKMH